MNPYSTVAYINLGDGDIWVERKPYSSDISELVYHTVKEGETIQSIAFQYYGDSGRWADICDVNTILNPFEELKGGMQLLIPS